MSNGWIQVWSDEFEGTALDNSKWSIGQEWTQQKTAYPSAATINGKPLVEVGNGLLTLYVQQEPSFGKNYSGGLVKTRRHGAGAPYYAFKYGYIEARIRYDMPGKGRHANFYTYGYDPVNGNPGIGGHFWPPEIDIAEVVSYGVNLSRYHLYLPNYHYARDGGGNRLEEPGVVNRDWHQDWHTWGANWRSDGRVDFYFDGQPVYSTTSSNSNTVWDIQHYLLLRMGTGDAGWGGDPDENTDPGNWPAKMEVDWIRVWQPPPPGWRASDWANFQSALISDGPLDDANNNQVPDLGDYAWNGTLSTTGELGIRAERISGGLRLDVPVNPDAGDLLYRAQRRTGDLSGWETCAEFSPAAGWVHYWVQGCSAQRIGDAVRIDIQTGESESRYQVEARLGATAAPAGSAPLPEP